MKFADELREIAVPKRASDDELDANGRKKAEEFVENYYDPLLEFLKYTARKGKLEVHGYLMCYGICDKDDGSINYHSSIEEVDEAFFIPKKVHTEYGPFGESRYPRKGIPGLEYDYSFGGSEHVKEKNLLYVRELFYKRLSTLGFSHLEIECRIKDAYVPYKQTHSWLDGPGGYTLLYKKDVNTKLHTIYINIRW